MSSLATPIFEALDESSLWRSHFDLPSLACSAATEIDNLVLGRETDLAATRQIVSLIDKDFAMESVSSSSVSLLLDPVTTVIMTQAMVDTSPLSAQLSTIEQVAKEGQKFKQRLQNVLDDPAKQSTEELREMCSFCLALSKCASIQQQGFTTWEPPVPFGK